MSEFQPIPVFVKQSQIAQELQLWNERKDYFQSIVNSFKKLNLSEPLFENDLVEMTEAPKNFLVKKITQGNEFNIGGMKLEPEKAFDLLEKPAGTNEFIEFIENSKKQESPVKWYHRHAYFFTIIKGLVEIKPQELEKITIQNTIFLNSQKDKDIYDLLKNLCDSINGLNKLKRIHDIDDALFTQLIQTDHQTDTVLIREDFLKIYNT